MIAFLPLVAMVAVAIVHVSFAIGVVIAIRRGKEQGHAPWFVGTEVWALATLIGGVIVAGIFWLIHHSTLSSDRK